MSKLKSELAFLKTQLNSHYGTSIISTSTTIRRVIKIKENIKKIEQRKSKILSLRNG